MLRCNVYEFQKQNTNDRKVICFPLGGVFLTPLLMSISANKNPYVNISGALSGKIGEILTLEISVTDPDGDAVSLLYTGTELIPVHSLTNKNPNTFLFSWTPSNADPVSIR